MKIVAMVARLLLGLMFFVFGLNHFLNFIPMGPLPAGAAGQFTAVLIATHYIYVVAAIEVVAAIPLLVNRYVPLGLTMLAPIIVNILLTQVLMMPSGLVVGLAVTLFWFLTFIPVRSAFAGILQQHVQA
jgi:hypothetical protein